MFESIRVRLAGGSLTAVLAISVLFAPAASLAEALPEDYPPDYGGVFPMAAIAVPLGLAMYPLLVLPALGFDGLDGASNLWNRMVWDPIQYVIRDRAGEAQY